MKPLNWKKNVFSYAAWLACLIMTGYGVWNLTRLRLSETGIPGGAIVYLVSGGVLLLAGLLNVLVLLFRKKRHRGRKIQKGIEWIGRLAEFFLFLVFLAAGMYLRWEKLPYADGMGYYGFAVVKAGQGLPLLQHGAGFLYVQALHGICFVLGNNPVFCAWFQLALQALAGIVCFLGIRRLTGSLSAVLFAACYFLSPGIVERAASLGPEPLFLFFFGIGLLAAGGFLKKNSGLPLGYLLTGAVIGFAVYLDISGLALLGILITVFFVEREEPERFWNGRVVSFLTALIGFAAALAGCFALDASFSGIPVNMAARAWGDLYLTAGNPIADPLRLLFQMDWGREMSSLLFMLSAIGIFSFFFKKRQERISVWVFTGGILFLLEVLGMTLPAMDSVEVFLLCLSALAGTALSNYGRETVLEKAGMRKWDPSLYGILEDNVEKQITDAELEGRYSEGESEDGNKGYRNVENPDGGYTEGEYYQAGKNAGNQPGSAGETGNGAAAAGQAVGKSASEEMPENGESASAGQPSRGRGNIITRFLDEKNRKKEQQRQEMERVLSALAAISEDVEVSISPDHKPGEELVRDPAKGGKENAAETAQSADGAKKGFRKHKSDTTAEMAPAPANAEPVERREKESAETAGASKAANTPEDGRRPLHNPLPLPKKKAATMLDYDYEVSDDDDYDYD